jgi:predicted transcriptional regulator
MTTRTRSGTRVRAPLTELENEVMQAVWDTGPCPVEGRAYVYRAVEPARSLAARAVRQIIDSFCQGSVEELVSGMVDAKVLSKSELQSLEEFVRSRKGGK